MDLLKLVFSLLIIISDLTFLGLIILLHFLLNKFNPIKNTVSDYAAGLPGKYRLVKAVMPVFGALSTLSLAIVMATGIQTVSTYVVLFLVISSICRFLIIFFPTDITGQPATNIGRLHLTFVMIAFAGIAFTASNFYITDVDKVIGQIVTVASILLLLGFLPMFKKIFGLLERIFLSSSILWLIILGFELLSKR